MLVLPLRGNLSALDEIVRKVDGRRTVEEMANVLGVEGENARARIARLVLDGYLILQRAAVGASRNELAVGRLARRA
jgi:hypothetical protein